MKDWIDKAPTGWETGDSGEQEMKRREFLRLLAGGSCAVGLCAACPFLAAPVLGQDKAGALLDTGIMGPDKRFVREARFYEKLQEKKIECQLCPRECRIADQERGYCGVRENQGGTYYTLVYNRPCSLNPDPIEKKPFFHFLPGTLAFSLATAGCNVECKFCQNWQISQYRPEQIQSRYVTPDEIVRLARETRCTSIAHTYTEPVIFYEYMYDIAARSREAGIHNVVVSNGYILEEPLRELCKVVSAIKIDLKAFTEEFYRDLCSGTLKPVLRALEIIKEEKVWCEIVVLLIPTLNDSEQEIKEMCRWIVKELGREVPVHFSRFHPTYKIKNLPRTPLGTLERAHGIARAEGIDFVYIGNAPGHKYEHTYCPSCGKLVIKRLGYWIGENQVQAGKCKYCQRAIPGVWS